MSIDPKALEAARFLVDAYSKRRPPGDAEPYALIVARALLAGEGNSATAAAVPRPSTADAKSRLSALVAEMVSEIGRGDARVVLLTHAHFIAQDIVGSSMGVTKGTACMCFFGTRNPNCRAHDPIQWGEQK